MAIAQDSVSPKRILGCTNYYSMYIKNYASVAGILQTKLQLNREDGKKGSKLPVHWKPDEVEAFQKIKNMLTESLELFVVDPNKPFQLRTDASNFAVGAVLEQERGRNGSQLHSCQES